MDIKPNSHHILYRMAPNLLNQNKNHLILARTFYRITTKVMGSGSNLSIWEPQMDPRRLKKLEQIFFVLFDVQSVK